MASGSSHNPGLNGLKRKLDKNPKLSEPTVNKDKNGECKRVVHEGYSWWTCLTMGMPIEQSRPHSQPKQSN